MFTDILATHGINLWLVGGGLVLGLAFGAIVQRSRFCMLAAVSNLVLMRDLRQVHAYLAAVAVAIGGTALLEASGLVAVAESAYRNTHLDWFGVLAGGLLFGFGTTIAGGCAGRTLVRTAEGNLGALLTLLAFALGATAALYGALVPLRVGLIELTAVELPIYDGSLAALVGVPALLLAGLLVTACVIFIAFTGRTTLSAGLLGAGALVGALVVAGWFVTGYLAQDEFALGVKRPASLTFAGPLAHVTFFVTTSDATGHGFTLALVGGVVAGAVLSALLTRSFHWVPPQVGHIGHHLVGGVFMGVGAVFAGGCNVGQGLTGVSTCSISAFVAVAAIFAGMRLGLAWLLRSEIPEASRSRSTHGMHVAHGSGAARAT